MKLIKEPELDKNIKITSAEDVYNYLEEFKDEDREYFIVIGLNNKNKILYREITNIGTIKENIIDPRTIFKNAIMKSVVKIIIAHNHPSGDIEPSKEDRRTTERLKEAGEILEIKILDHIIIGTEGYYSIEGEENEI